MPIQNQNINQGSLLTNLQHICLDKLLSYMHASRIPSTRLWC